MSGSVARFTLYSLLKNILGCSRNILTVTIYNLVPPIPGCLRMEIARYFLEDCISFARRFCSSSIRLATYPTLRDNCTNILLREESTSPASRIHGRDARDVRK